VAVIVEYIVVICFKFLIIGLYASGGVDSLVELSSTRKLILDEAWSEANGELSRKKLTM
jgi:hypothetical protein